jgi:excinuclease ABC subunit A
MDDCIHVKGAREHNLKNIEVVIPRDAITVITGPSGSGKSSLAMDTIYAEGQRRYVESLSAYARQFLDQMQKPEVDFISGLSPAIAISQKTFSKSPRSTVGTITEIYDYMRVLYTRIGIAYCYQCGSPITAQDIQNIIRSVTSLPSGTKLQILAPIAIERKGEYKKELQQMRRDGFVRARIDGEMVDLTHDVILRKQQRHTIEIVVDRFIVKPALERQIKLAIDTALRYTDTVVINLLDDNRDILFSRTLACPQCGISYPEIEPHLFSFNSRYGACPRCKGLGFEERNGNGKSLLESFTMPKAGNGRGGAHRPPSEPELSRLPLCRACHGLRLRREALSIMLQGVSIGEFARMTVKEASRFIDGIALSEREMAISRRVVKEVKDRLLFLERVGLDYLTLDRPSLTLSGGEAQRIKLATQLGSSLTGVLYVLDEPSIGLHPRDCGKLLTSLSLMRDAGNTIIIVEHDEETIRAADHVIDMGPGAGRNGGWVTATGTPAELERDEKSLSGMYLGGRSAIAVPPIRRVPRDFVKIIGAAEFNLKNATVAVPLGVFVCVTGVSGSGKSTLIGEILYKAVVRNLYGNGVEPGRHRKIEGLEKIDRAIAVDQSPLGRTPRSNPATYSGVFSVIRSLFAQLPDSRARGYGPSRFSFNVSGGRCEACAGDGLKKVEMHFLPDVYVLCDSCGGTRYNRETREVFYRGKNIADVLEMTISEALEFFHVVPPVRAKLQVLEDLGMGYLKLGQSATTLSGGEAQRLRLSRELAKKGTGNTLYLLDEPTTGLHFVDIQRLLDMVNRLVDMGNTVIVIEHDMDVVKSADYVIDLGPGSGDEGGKIVAVGTPEEIARETASHTGRYLARKL